MWAVVPAKPLRAAKQRLAGVLSAGERHELARRMTSDVLRSLSAAAAVQAVIVVGSDPEIAAIAAEHGARVVADEDSGHTAAVECGLGALRAAGIGTALVLSADVPRVTVDEIDRLLAEHRRNAARGPAVTVVSDRRRDGTNAVCCSPLDAIPFAFGLGSLQRHSVAARTRHVAFGVLDLPGIALDIDEPEDLRALINSESVTTSARYLRDLGLASRLAGLFDDPMGPIR